MNDKLILLFVFIGVLIVLSSFRRNRKRKIIFFGDSITKAGIEPKGYINIINNIRQRESIVTYDLFGAGIGGNKVYDLYLRIEEDVISKSPDIVVVYIGVNDVWHKKTHGTGTDKDTFAQFYRAIVRKLQAANARVVLCTPAVIGEKINNNNEQDEDLNVYSAIISSIGSDLQLPVCDLRRLFLDYLQQHNPDNFESGILTTDGVHLNEMGNRIVAEAIWEQLEGMIKRQ